MCRSCCASTRRTSRAGSRLTRIYRHAGFPVFPTSAGQRRGRCRPARGRLRGKTVAFTGNSGVGKSSVLNCLDRTSPSRRARSRKSSAAAAIRRAMWSCMPLADGHLRRSTRRAFPHLTPSSMELILKENLAVCLSGFCPVSSAAAAITTARICPSRAAPCSRRLRQASWSRLRHASYARLYEAAKEIRLWEHKQP